MLEQNELVITNAKRLRVSSTGLSDTFTEMFVCVCVCMHAHACVCVCTCACIHTCVCPSACIHTCICIVCMYICYMYVFVQVCKCIPMFLYEHVLICL